MKNIIYNILLVLFVTIFAASGVMIGYKLFSKNKVENQIEDLKAVFQEPPGQAAKPLAAVAGAAGEAENALPSEETLEEQFEKRKGRLTGYAKLQDQNSDMKGWLTIPDTGIDYPVMQSVDRPDYYLKKDFKGQKSSHGTPYIAESCDLLGGEDNIVIYGHHMKDGTMFADLMKYADKGYYTSHPIVWFDTLDRVAAYQIIAVTNASASSAEDERLFTLAADRTKRQEFLDEVGRRSFYDTVQPGGTGGLTDNGQPLLVLITCEYTQNEGRLLVVAREVV